MEFIYTNGENQDFIELCKMLDNDLNQIVGGEKQREQYNQYNSLELIKDVVLVYDNNIPIACGSFKEYDIGVAEVKRMFVKKEFRGKGIAKKIMNILEDKVKEKDFYTLILETGELLVEAIGLYKKLGFSIMENYGQYKNMKESVCMQKKI